MKPLTVLLLTLAICLAGCDGAATPQEHLDSAQSALNAGDYEQAQADAVAAAKGAGEAGDAALAWRAKSLEMFALGRQGKGAEVLAALKAAETKWGGKVDAKFLNRIIGEVDKGGDITGAIAVLNHGVERFPEHKGDFDKYGQMLAAKASAGASSDAIEMLKKLGYL